MKSNLYMLL